ncbi:MAG: creatininase [Maritimibacter sp.]|nr:creatininase [Maritimibacter sp.]
MLWQDLKHRDFANGALADAVALVPCGATEQHGPHLPLGTDTFLSEAVATKAVAQVKTATVVQFPTLDLTASREHHDYAGSVWIEPEELVIQLMAIGRAVTQAGMRRIVFINGHGGNIPALQIACRRLRIEHGLFAVAAGWMTPGMPRVPAELKYPDDVHAGFMETAAMLHVRPDLVDMSAAADFVPAARAVAEANTHLRLIGPITTGWTARDLTPDGASGNAAAATPEAGKVIVETCATAFAEMLDEIAAHQPGFPPAT